jgi:predicted RNase H-like nuclease
MRRSSKNGKKDKEGLRKYKEVLTEVLRIDKEVRKEVSQIYGPS